MKQIVLLVIVYGGQLATLVLVVVKWSQGEYLKPSEGVALLVFIQFIFYIANPMFFATLVGYFMMIAVF